jgi:hypothetical protein
MAGDWIKMRVNLVTHPKVLAISEYLSSNGDYQDWSTMSGFAPSIGGSRDDCERDFQASLRVTRYVTVCALLRYWGYANEHAKDEFISTLRVRDLDDVVQVPGFGKALESVGWVEYDADRHGLYLPNFNEYNTSGNERSASAKSAAERQKAFRERHKSNVTSNVTVTRDSNRREEKRREEKNIEDSGAEAQPANAAPTPKTKKAKPQKTALPENFSVSERVRTWAKVKGFDRLDEHLESFLSKAKANAYTYADWDEAFMNAIRDDWAKLRSQRGYAPAPITVTVPSRQGIDPALAKVIADAKNCKPPPAEIRARMAELSGARA